MAIPWDTQAHFNDIDGGEGFTGTLVECVEAYRALPEDRKRGALITTDELVEVPNQPSAISNLDHDALAWLAGELDIR